MYKLTPFNSVIRLSDMASIPICEGNTDYQEYLKWLDKGNTPIPNCTNDESKSNQWDKIKSERDRRMEVGGYLVNGKWFHSDQASRTQQLGLVLLGNNIPVGLQWKTMDGTFIEMTPTLAQQILAGAALSDYTIFVTAETHKTNLYLSADPENYNIMTNWPKMYSET